MSRRDAQDGDAALDAPRTPPASGPWPGGRFLRVVLAVALVLRLAFLAFAIGDEAHLTELADAEEYVALANDLGGGYGGSDEALFDTGLRRPPAYPVALWLGLELTGGSLIGALVPFVVLSVLTVYLTYRLAARLLGEEVGRWAALLLALDPISIVWSTYPQPEVLFTCLVMVALLLLVRGVEQARAAPFAVAGLLVGVSALARPVGVYLAPVLAVAVVAMARAAWRRRVVFAALLLVGAAVPIGAWTARNADASGVAVLSTVEGKNLLFYRAAGTLAEDEGLSVDDAQAQLRAEAARRYPPGANAAERSRVERSLAIETMREHPLGYPPMAAKGVARLMIGPGRSPLVTRVTGSDDDGLVASALVAGAWAMLLVIYVAVAAGVWAGARLPFRRWLLPALVAGYLVVVQAGADAYSRYRYPIMPMVAIIGGVGVVRIVGVLSTRRARAQSLVPSTAATGGPAPSG